MNRQVLPSMLLSVLIVCVSAVALRPVERPSRPAIEPPAAATDATPTTANPAAPPRPEPETAATEPEPEPEIGDEQDAPAPVESEAEAEAEADPGPKPIPLDEPPEPFDEQPAVDELANFFAFPPLVGSPPVEPPDAPGAFVGPPIEAASIAAPPEPKPEPKPEPEPEPKPEPEPVAAPVATAPKPPTDAGSISIPRSETPWFGGNGPGPARGAIDPAYRRRDGDEHSRRFGSLHLETKPWAPLP